MKNGMRIGFSPDCRLVHIPLTKYCLFIPLIGWMTSPLRKWNQLRWGYLFRKRLAVCPFWNPNENEGTGWVKLYEWQTLPDGYRWF